MQVNYKVEEYVADVGVQVNYKVEALVGGRVCVKFTYEKLVVFSNFKLKVLK